ncbi:MAG: 16S rRNA (guanine(527)-N(7))-methyltransferase RsmG [Tepidisphaeraceae bacterium]
MNPLWNQIAAGSLTDDQLARLDAYLDALIETNKTLNLTRITDRADAEAKHVADALTLLPYLPGVGEYPPPLEGGGRGRGPRSTPTPRMIRIAKKLRREMTGPEKNVWAQLRNKRADLKFRRQQPIGSYVVDFFCSDAKLIVEIDGLSHEFATEADTQRQAWLEQQGYRVVRFTNDDAVRDVEAVVQTILNACADDGRTGAEDRGGPLPPPPPSRGGGENTTPIKPTRWPTAYLADVGTGGGVPGVILAIARPDLAVTLIDSTKKKLDAVAAMCRAVGITNVRTLHSRIEETKQEFDVVTARGVAALDKLVGWCRPILKPTGTLLALKGPKAAEEITAAEAVLKRSRLRARLHPVDVPELAGHAIVVVRR